MGVGMVAQFVALRNDPSARYRILLQLVARDKEGSTQVPLAQGVENDIRERRGRSVIKGQGYQGSICLDTRHDLTE